MESSRHITMTAIMALIIVFILGFIVGYNWPRPDQEIGANSTVSVYETSE